MDALFKNKYKKMRGLKVLTPLLTRMDQTANKSSYGKQFRELKQTLSSNTEPKAENKC